MKPRRHVVVARDHDLHRRAPLADEAGQVLLAEELQVLLDAEPGAEPGTGRGSALGALGRRHGATGPGLSGGAPSAAAAGREKETPQ